jgi:hypothetical protein
VTYASNGDLNSADVNAKTPDEVHGTQGALPSDWWPDIMQAVVVMSRDMPLGWPFPLARFCTVELLRKFPLQPSGSNCFFFRGHGSHYSATACAAGSSKERRLKNSERGRSWSMRPDVAKGGSVPSRSESPWRRHDWAKC